MTDRALAVYHRLPAPGRSLVASLRGYSLSRWRYGPDSERLVAEALERESWSATRWKSWRDERLAALLHRARTKVPYYRDHWAQRRIRGDRSSWEYLEHWPVVTKEDLRQVPLRFVADDCSVGRLFHERTSGTTGKPLDLYWGRGTVRAWFALLEARTRRWNGVSRRDRWAILGGQPVVPARVRKPPFWVFNVPMRQLYLSSNHVSRQNARDFIDALADYGATHLLAYSSSASILAAYARERSIRAPSLRVVITNAEPLHPWQRETIRAGFGCAVRETYGMAEAVAAASECASGTLHLWPEVGCFEVWSDGEDVPAATGSTGRLVSTGLLNFEMPLIRYVVGDRGRMPEEESACSCGRLLPALTGLEGRTNDVLIAPDGRRVFWLNAVFYGTPIREAQIVQDEPDEVRVLYVPAPAFDAQAGRSIAERIRVRMGDVRVQLEPATEIPRGPNGKFRAVVCNLPGQWPVEASERPATIGAQAG